MTTSPAPRAHRRSLARPHGALRVCWRLPARQPRKYAVRARQRLLQRDTESDTVTGRWLVKERNLAGACRHLVTTVGRSPRGACIPSTLRRLHQACETSPTPKPCPMQQPLTCRNHSCCSAALAVIRLAGSSASIASSRSSSVSGLGNALQGLGSHVGSITQRKRMSATLARPAAG